MTAKLQYRLANNSDWIEVIGGQRRSKHSWRPSSEHHYKQLHNTDFISASVSAQWCDRRSTEPRV